MKFYIASGLKNAQNVQKAATLLKGLGHEQTYDWTVHGDVRAQGAARMAQTAQNEADAVKSSSLVLILLPGGHGTHTELGIAIASCVNKEIYIHSPTGEEFAYDARTCAFYYHPAVKRFTGGFDAFLTEVASKFGGNL